MRPHWRKCLTVFRWCRFTLWSVILLALLAFGWLNLIGLPDFAKKPFSDTLRERGVQLEFNRMRLRLIHGLVAENVRVGKNDGTRAQLTASEVQMHLNYPALFHGNFQVDAVVLRNGKFTLPVSPSNSLTLLNIQTEIRLLPGQTWALDDLQADFAGTRLRLSGQLEHAPEIAQWAIFNGRKTAEPSLLSQPLKDFADHLARIHFIGQPQLAMNLNGDARDIHSVILRMNANVPAVTSPWISSHQLQFAARLTAPTDAPIGTGAELDFWTNAFPFRFAWIARAADLRSEDFNIHAVQFRGLWAAPILFLEPVSARLSDGKIDVAANLNVFTRNVTFTNGSDIDPHIFAPLLPEAARQGFQEVLWTRPPVLHVAGSVTLPPWTNGLLVPPKELLPGLHLDGDVAFSNAVLHGTPVDLVSTHFNFTNSLCTLTDLEFAQANTRLALNGQFSAVTENFRLSLRGPLDVAGVRSFLPGTNALRALSLVQLTEPLNLDLNAAGNLAALADTTATGHLSLTNFAVRGQTLESVDTDVVCSNRVLSFLHPQAFRYLGEQTMTADSITLDFNARMIFFTNGFSTFDQMIIPRAIGPKTAHIIQPYLYLSPPTVRVHGQFPLRDVNSGRDLAGTDLTFEVIRGAPFRWSRLVATNLTGTLRWTGQYLLLTNVAAGGYGGSATGNAYFDFRPVDYDCDFTFQVAATNVDVHALAVGLSGSPTNKLEGRLSGQVNITAGNTATWQSWFGHGSLRLRDGLLWNIPLFGFASPVLNAFSPGLGNSRATEATLNFVMTNGVARTSSLTINTPTMRLQYSGTVDLQQRVNAYVTAELMRNTWGIGPVISTVLWPVSKIFECRVNGLVSDPKVTPVLFPFSKYLLAPFHPIRSMQELFSSPENSPASERK